MNSWFFKHSICGLKMSISGSLPVKISSNFFFLKIFIAPKVPPWNFRGSLLSYFSAIAFIFAVIGIFEYFGSLLPDGPVGVKFGFSTFLFKEDTTGFFTRSPLNKTFRVAY